MATFDGFSKETSTFLRGLGRNNTKKWFDAHRDAYEAYYLGPAKALVEAFGEQIGALGPGVTAEPRVNGSIFRVNRDIRFAKDKTPYKDHIDLWLWAGPDRKRAVSGFFLRIRANAVEIGAGNHGFEKSALAAYRERVADPQAGKALESAVAKVERAGFPVQGETYKKLPRGAVPVSAQRDRLLRHSALFCSSGEPLPKAFHGRAFASWCIAKWKRMLPLHRWIVDELS